MKKQKVVSFSFPVWESIPQKEPPGNPWAGDSRIEKQGDDKVLFFEEGHKYILQDANGGYPDFIISGSKLIEYWDNVVKVKERLGDGIDVLKEATKTLKDNSFNYRAYFDPIKPIAEGQSIGTIRTMLVGYLNGFKSDAPISYVERCLGFIKYAPADCSQCVRHRVFQLLETWITSDKNDIRPYEEEFEPDMVNVIRFLYDPIRGFEGVYAKNKLGMELKNVLEKERERLSQNHMRLDYLISESEWKSVPFIVPASSGTLLHAHMERHFKGQTHPLPLMRELEDEAQTSAFIKFAEQQGWVFRPEFIEKRLGSLLYKICGSVDAIAECKDGELQIMDWKRTPKIMDWNETTSAKGYSFTSNVMKYSIQMAAYRKLLMMEFEQRGITQKVKSEAILVIFHPINSSFKTVHLDLTQPMKAASVKTTKGVADRVHVDGTVEIWQHPLSPIDYVEALFEKRLEHLRYHFS